MFTLQQGASPVVARSRQNPEVRVSGLRWFNNNPGAATGAGQVITGFHNCSDTTGKGDCGPFDVYHKSTSGGVINKFDSGAFSSQFRDYICDWLRSTGNGGHLGVSGQPSDISVCNYGAARTNPSRPYVDVPANVLDIGSRPGRILEDIQDLRRRGFWRRPPRPSPRELARGAGQAWLQYNFMIAPIVGDIVKLQHGVREINNRISYINRLFRGHGIRRTIPVFTGSAAQKSSITVQSLGTIIQRDFEIQTVVEKKVHTRWKPQHGCTLKPSPRQVSKWATRSVLGLTVDLSTLWEITPWSWLADWYGDVGTYLKATRNIVPARLSDVCPMTHIRTTYACPGFQTATTTMTPIKMVREEKHRSIGFLAPTAHLNFLSGSQMGILAAVGASRL